MTQTRTSYHNHHMSSRTALTAALDRRGWEISNPPDGVASEWRSYLMCQDNAAGGAWPSTPAAQSASRQPNPLGERE